MPATGGGEPPGAGRGGGDGGLVGLGFRGHPQCGRDFSPGALALGRLVCGSVVLGLVAWARGEGWPPRAAWPGIVASGVLWFGAYTVALNWGEQKVDAGTAAMVVSLGPVIIALLSGWMLGEGFPRGLVAGVTVALAGVIVVGVATSGTGHASVSGVLLCLAAAVAFAVAVVSQKPALRYASALQVTTFGAALGALACLPFSGQLVSQVATAPLSATLKVCYLGVFPTAVGFTTWAYALARTPAGKMPPLTWYVRRRDRAVPASIPWPHGWSRTVVGRRTRRAQANLLVRRCPPPRDGSEGKRSVRHG